MVSNNQSSYKLGTIRIDVQQKTEVRLIRSIPTTDMERIEEAIHKLNDFNKYWGLYEICEANYQSILSLHATIEEGLKHNKRGDYVEKVTLEMNRLLLNYLSSFKTYIDHFETRYTRLDRQGSSCYDSFKDITAKCYDTNFSYRFLSKLRNYAQHCKLPVAGIKIDKHLDHNGNTIIDFEIGFDRDTLIREYNEWGKLKNDLQTQPECMELMTYLEEFKTQLQLINRIVIGIETSLVLDSWFFLYELIAEIQTKYPDGQPFIGRYIESESDRSKPKMDVVNFPFNTMAKLQKIILQGQGFTNNGIQQV